MALNTSVEKIEDLINTKDIKLWFSANDVDLPLDTSPITLTCKYTNTVFTRNVADIRLQTDSQGYKCLRTLGGVASNYSNSAYFITTTNYETVIIIMNIYTNVNGIIGYVGDTNCTFRKGVWGYANSIVNNGRLDWDVTNTFSKKVINTGVVNSQKMEVYDGFKSVAILRNPATGGGAYANRLFENNTASSTVIDYYFFARIQNVYDDNTLKKLIRTIAFQHGVNI